MSRRKDSRRSRSELKLFVERLESRRLLSADVRRPRPDRAAAPLARDLDSLLDARADAESFARELVRHPGLAGEIGLGALAEALRQHDGYAARHGWAATLVHELETHPYYAAAHHLWRLVAHASPAPAPIAPVVAPAAPAAGAGAASPTASPPPSDPPASAAPPAVPIVAQDPQTVAVGGYLDVTLPSLGLGGSALSYTITPQPLPANMTFNRGTGALVFAPAPGQAGTDDFTVAVSGASGSGTIDVPVTVTDPAVPSTEISGQVVDQDGQPLAGMPVSIGAASTVTDDQGDFTLTGIPASPGPLSAGGSVASAEGRLALTAPVPQLLGHAVYMGARNVLPSPLIVPTVNWSAPSSFNQLSASQSVDLTNPAMPGFDIQVPASPSGGNAASGTLSLAMLPASVSAQHEPQGVSGPLLLYQVDGSTLPGPVQLTLPNLGGYAPGAVLALLAFNPLTGGHDVIGRMVVSSDGQTMTSSGMVLLHPDGSSSTGGGVQSFASPDETVGCVSVGPTQSNGTQVGFCAGCETTAKAAAAAPASGPTPLKNEEDKSAGGGGGGGGGAAVGGSLNSAVGTGLLRDGGGDGGGGGSSAGGGATSAGSSGSSSSSGYSSSSGSSGYSNTGAAPGMILRSNAGLVSGDYFLDHSLVPYQAQGQEIGVDLQYNSGQAESTPVVEYQFTTPYAGDSSAITSITAQVALGGVIQGQAVTYNTPGGLSDGQTYDVPLQVDAAQLATGVYAYTMTLTETFGSGSNATSITANYDGNVNVVNAGADPYGAGWSVGGLQHLAQVSPGGPVLVTAGSQGTEAFDPVYDSGQTSIQDLALVASTSSAQVLANDGTGGFSSPGSSSAGPVAAVSGDFNGDGLPDLAVVSTNTLSILLNNGSGGFNAGNTYTLPSGYVARGIVAGNFSGHANGVLDLAVLLSSDYGSNYEVAEYTGSGNGSFASAVISAVGNGSASTNYSEPTRDSIVAAAFNGDGLTDLAFATDNGLADVMLATGGGSFGAATALALPSGHEADGVTAVDFNGGAEPDLVFEAANTNLSDSAGPFASLDAFTNNGSGSFSFASTYQTAGHPDSRTLGLVAGDFQGAATGTEIAVPLVGDSTPQYLTIVPLSTSATWGQDQLYTMDSADINASYPTAGTIVAADFNGAGKPSIALTSSKSDQIQVLLADPASNQFLPMESIPVTAGNYKSIGVLVAAPFMGHAATPGYRGPTSDPSTLVQNANGTWTRTYPDGTVIQFNAAGQETSIADSNGNTFSYAYVATGPAAGALATITDPVGLATTFAYNASGYLSTITDPAGRATTFTIDAAGDLTEVVAPDGAVSQYGYNAQNEVTSETDADGRTTTVTYNGFGQFESEELPGGGTTSVDPAQSNGLLAPGDEGSLETTYQGSVTDPGGRTTTLTFNWMSHPTQEVDGNGGVTTITYNRQGFAASVTDPMDRTVSYTYDASGDITSIVEYELEPGQRTGTTLTETIAYNDAYGVPTSITDFDDNTTTFALDARGDVLEEEQPGGVDQEWTYNAAGQPLTYTDADGATTTYTYNTLGRLTTITEPLPGDPTVQYGYDAAGDVTSITDEVGDTTTYTYDQAGRILTEQNPVQAADGTETSFAYDAVGNLLSMTDADGGTTEYTYNARNEVTSVTDPMDRVTSYTYDVAGDLTSAIDAMGRTTDYSYDADNNLVSVTDPTGGTTTYTRDLDGEVTSVTDPRGFETNYAYDTLGRVVGVSEPGIGAQSGEEVAVATYTYDPDGNLLTSVDGNDHTTTYVYNALGEETSATNADGDEVQYTYDGDGNVLSATDGLGHTTSDTYDAMGDVLTETDPSGGGTTTYRYDAAGDLLSLTDPDGNVTSYTYTAAHQVATETTPTGGVYTYTYDADGNLTQSVDPDGHEIQYAYDADGELTSETWVNPAGGSYDVFHYGYDADGELTSVSDDNASYQYTYTSDGEVASFGDAGTAGLPSVTLDYTYDADGDRTSMSDSLGGLVSYTYDARDELSNLTLSGTGIAPEAVKYSYDNAGNMTGLTRYSNLAETTVVASTAYTYDNADQMTGITDKNSSGTTLVSYGYTYDAAGRVTQEARTWASGAESDTLTYGYTNNNQLTSVTHTNASFANESFSWDANGNETGTGYTTSTGNEQTASPGWTYTYDADGNMVTATQTSTGDVWTYSYDFRNRMTGAVEKDSSGTVLETVSYTYDALDNRIGVDENGTQTWTLYDGSTPIMDFTGSGSLASRYLNGPAGQIVDEVLARESANGTVAWYLPDRLGTIRDLIDNSGNIIDHVDDSAFGTVLDESNPSNGDRLMGFAGLERDTVTGLNLAVHRVEDPGTGRWTSEDPLGFAADDMDLYRYVGNGPDGASDPQGLGSVTTGIRLGPGGYTFIIVPLGTEPPAPAGPVKGPGGARRTPLPPPPPVPVRPTKKKPSPYDWEPGTNPNSQRGRDPYGSLGPECPFGNPNKRPTMKDGTPDYRPGSGRTPYRGNPRSPQQGPDQTPRENGNLPPERPEPPEVPEPG